MENKQNQLTKAKGFGALLGLILSSFGLIFTFLLLYFHQQPNDWIMKSYTVDVIMVSFALCSVFFIACAYVLSRNMREYDKTHYH